MNASRGIRRQRTLHRPPFSQHQRRHRLRKEPVTISAATMLDALEEGSLLRERVRKLIDRLVDAFSATALTYQKTQRKASLFFINIRLPRPAKGGGAYGINAQTGEVRITPCKRASIHVPDALRNRLQAIYDEIWRPRRSSRERHHHRSSSSSSSSSRRHSNKRSRSPEQHPPVPAKRPRPASPPAVSTTTTTPSSHRATLVYLHVLTPVQQEEKVVVAAKEEQQQQQHKKEEEEDSEYARSRSRSRSRSESASLDEAKAEEVDGATVTSRTATMRQLASYAVLVPDMPMSTTTNDEKRFLGLVRERLGSPNEAHRQIEVAEQRRYDQPLYTAVTRALAFLVTSKNMLSEEREHEKRNALDAFRTWLQNQQVDRRTEIEARRLMDHVIATWTLLSSSAENNPDEVPTERLLAFPSTPLVFPADITLSSAVPLIFFMPTVVTQATPTTV